MMQSVAKFGTSAYRVSGSCDDLLQLLPDTLHVQGRIAHEQVWDYLLQLKSSTSRVWIINCSFFIDNIYITLTIRTNNTYNTLGYNERKKKYNYIHYYGLLISVTSYKVQRKVIYSSRSQTFCQLKVSIYCYNVHLY